MQSLATYILAGKLFTGAPLLHVQRAMFLPHVVANDTALIKLALRICPTDWPFAAWLYTMANYGAGVPIDFL